MSHKAGIVGGQNVRTEVHCYLEPRREFVTNPNIISQSPEALFYSFQRGVEKPVINFIYTASGSEKSFGVGKYFVPNHEVN